MRRGQAKRKKKWIAARLTRRNTALTEPASKEDRLGIQASIDMMDNMYEADEARLRDEAMARAASGEGNSEEDMARATGSVVTGPPRPSDG